MLSDGLIFARIRTDLAKFLIFAGRRFVPLLRGTDFVNLT